MKDFRDTNFIFVIGFWLLSLLSAVILFIVINETFAEGKFLGFKLGGGIAGCIVIYLILTRSYLQFKRNDLEIHLRKFEGKEPENINTAIFYYRVVNSKKPDEWIKAEFIVQIQDKFIVIPNISFTDIVEIKLEASNGIWKSDKITSSKRHILLNKANDIDNH